MKTSFLILAAVWMLSIATAYLVGKKSATHTEIANSKKLSENARSTSRKSSASSNEGGGRADRSRKTTTGGASESIGGKNDPRKITSIMRKQDPIARANDVLGLIESLRPGDFEKVVADFRALGMTNERMSEYAMLLHAWAKVDPIAALDYAKENTGTRFARQTILASWATDNPNAALNWAKENHEGNGANPWLVGVVRGLAANDIAQATEVLQMLPYSRERGNALTSVIAQLGTMDSDQAIEWLSGITDERLKNGATARLASQLANKDPESTAQWVSTIDDEEARRSASAEVASAWAQKDFDSALNWVDSLDGRVKTRAASSLMGNYIRKDIQQATTWMNSMADEPGYNDIRHSYIWNTSGDYPDLSLNQIGQMEPGRQQNRYYRRVLRRWWQRDADAATQWMNNNNTADDIRRRVTR